VQLLSRPENTAHQTVRNHEVMADGDAVHGWPPRFNQSGACDRRDACGAATRCGIKSGKVENALSPPGERGIVTAEF
jgi:hypothetical protein